MKHQPSSLALLRSANPVSVDPTAARSPQAAAVFEQIVTEPRNPQGRLRWRHAAGLPAGGRGPRARLAVGGAGISAVAAAIIVAAISGSAAGPAFAGWSARPAPALPGQITNATRRCGLAAPVLVEARGPYTAEVFASRSGGSACVEGPSVSFVGSIGGVQAPDNPITPNQIQTAAASASDVKGHAFRLLAGRVGSAVRSIVIHRSNHIDVIASIKNGWYLAWWPARAHATDATVTTSSGVHEIALPSLATSSPASCGGPSGTGCAALQAGSNGSAGVPGPPLIGGPLAKPFGGILLLQVENALKVLVCFHPPRNATAAMQPNGPTGPCTHAARLTRLPPSYPVQKNLLEVFPKSVWKVKLPTGTGDHAALVVLVVAFGTPSQGQIRNEITVNR
jgi:hypothetical protein